MNRVHFGLFWKEGFISTVLRIRLQWTNDEVADLVNDKISNFVSEIRQNLFSIVRENLVCQFTNYKTSNQFENCNKTIGEKRRILNKKSFLLYQNITKMLFLAINGEFL